MIIAPRRSPRLVERISAPRLHYAFRCFDRNGRLRWAEGFDNLVTTAGKDDLLDKYFAGSAYTAAWYLGLITNPNQVTGESVGTGNGATVTFTHTAANLPVNASSVTITAGSVTATDDGNGNLTGTGVSSGTINYTTGAVSITYTTAPANAVAITMAYTYAPTFAAADTSASHAGWAEFQGYSAATRPAPSWSAASGGSKATSAAIAYSINADGIVAGAFTITNSTKGGTTGILYSEGSFKNTNGYGTARSVQSGDTLNATLTLSV